MGLAATSRHRVGGGGRALQSGAQYLSGVVFKKVPALAKHVKLFFVPMACAVCFGSPDSLSSKALAVSVFVLFGIVACVLAGIGWTAFVWARRAKALDHSG